MEEEIYVSDRPSDQNKAVMSIGEWIVVLLVQLIPCVGFILYCVWAFGNGNENRKNFCRASLIFMVISAVFAVIMFVAFGAALFTMMESSGYYY